MASSPSARERRQRDVLIPWILFNFIVAIFPVLLRGLIRYLKGSDPFAALTDEPDFLIASFAMCAATAVDLIDAREKRVFPQRPYMMYFTLALFGLPAFIVYILYVYDKIDSPTVSTKLQLNASSLAVAWVLVTALISIGIKFTVVRKESKTWT